MFTGQPDQTVQSSLTSKTLCMHTLGLDIAICRMCRVLTSIQQGLKKVHIAQNLFTDPLSLCLIFF